MGVVAEVVAAVADEVTGTVPGVIRMVSVVVDGVHTIVTVPQAGRTLLHFDQETDIFIVNLHQ